MKKLIKSVFFGTFALLILGIITLYLSRPTRIFPYPYKIVAQIDELDLAKKAKILVIGDQLGSKLASFLDLGPNITIIDWARQNEGLHRTLHKLKKLDDWPKIIIYHGGSSEFYERKFLVSQYHTIKTNFKFYENPRILSMIEAFPVLSRFIYLKEDQVTLNLIVEDETPYSSEAKQKQMELSYYLFKNELEELIRTARKKGSKLILVNTPINYENRPNKSCESSVTPTLMELQDQIETLIEKGKSKEAYKLAQDVLAQSLANALAYYQAGLTSLKLGRISKAKSQLKMAQAYDCDSKAGSPVFNQIMERAAKTYPDLLFFDFDQIVTQAMGNNELFIDKIHPQEIYYKQIIKEISTKLKEIIVSRREEFFE